MSIIIVFPELSWYYDAHYDEVQINIGYISCHDNCVCHRCYVIHVYFVVTMVIHIVVMEKYIYDKGYLGALFLYYM